MIVRKMNEKLNNAVAFDRLSVSVQPSKDKYASAYIPGRDKIEFVEQHRVCARSQLNWEKIKNNRKINEILRCDPVCV